MIVLLLLLVWRLARFHRDVPLIPSRDRNRALSFLARCRPVAFGVPPWRVSELVVPLAWLIGLGAALGAGRPLEPRVLIDSVRRVVLRAGRRRVAARSVGRVGGLPFVIRGHRYVPLLASWVVGLD